MFTLGDEFTVSGAGHGGLGAAIAIFGWLSTASFLFALILWVICGMAEYRTPIPKLSESLSSLDTTLRETETAITRLRGQAVEVEESIKKDENLSAKTASELDSLQSALALARKSQGEIKMILTGSRWEDRVWSFVLGLLSSFIVTCLPWLVYHYRKTRTTRT
jgi:hypothetical protein